MREPAQLSSREHDEYAVGMQARMIILRSSSRLHEVDEGTASIIDEG